MRCDKIAYYKNRALPARDPKPNPQIKVSPKAFYAISNQWRDVVSSV